MDDGQNRPDRPQRRRLRPHFRGDLGSDGLDHSVADRPFAWPVQRDLRSYKVGYFPRRETETSDREELKVLKDLGVTLVEMAPLPNDPPASAMLTILNAECSAAFDDLTRTHVAEGIGSWPATFREGQFIPAVEYLRAARHRRNCRMRDRMKKSTLTSAATISPSPTSPATPRSSSPSARTKTT